MGSYVRYDKMYREGEGEGGGVKQHIAVSEITEFIIPDGMNGSLSCAVGGSKAWFQCNRPARSSCSSHLRIDSCDPGDYMENMYFSVSHRLGHLPFWVSRIEQTLFLYRSILMSSNPSISTKNKDIKFFFC